VESGVQTESTATGNVLFGLQTRKWYKLRARHGMLLLNILVEASGNSVLLLQRVQLETETRSKVRLTALHFRI